ncbi:polysaccharide deacetylase family protein [Myxococcaceae bacterium GXIMD 01537]
MGANAKAHAARQAVNTKLLVSRARTVTKQSLGSVLVQGLKEFSYYAGLFPMLPQSGASWPVILFYHKVQQEPAGVWGERVLDAEEFERHVAFLAREYEPLHLPALMDALRRREPLPPRAVVLTFDDGYRNNLRVAAPILRRYRVPATLFVATGLVGTGAWMWAYELEHVFSRYPLSRIQECARHPVVAHFCSLGLDKRVTMLACVEYLKLMPASEQQAVLARLRETLPVAQDEENRFLSWDEVRELRDTYGFEIGAHTASHAILTRQSPEEVERELRECRDTLERELGARPTLFAYPNGDTNAEVSALVGRYFEAGFTTCPSACLPSLSPLELPRFAAPARVSELAFRLALQQMQTPLPFRASEVGR